MPFTPDSSDKIRLPFFESKDEGLKKALNLLARAIEKVGNNRPDIRLTSGNMEWTGNTLMLTPERPVLAAAVATPSLYLVSVRPSYVPVGEAVAEGYTSTFLTWGFCNGRLPTNWGTRIDSVMTGTYIKYFMLKVNFATAAQLKVSSCAWEVWDSVDEKEDNEWGEDGSRPAFIYIDLGTLYVTDGVPSLFPSGAGSLLVIEHLSGLIQNGSLGFRYQKSLTYSRLNY